ncbi:hypothetical protein BOX15_Mlig004669g4, partial [Macrostomum lignano]
TILTNDFNMQTQPECIPSLGRPFQLGQLYDIRQHRIITQSAWPSDRIRKMTTRLDDAPSVRFSLDYEYSSKRRAEQLGLNAQLRFCIEFKALWWTVYEKTMTGSAKYVTEASSTETSGSVTLQYDVKGAFEELQCCNELVDNEKKLLSTGATHVVTGIRYGGKAFIVCKGWSNASSFFERATSDCHELVDWKVEQWIRDAGQSARSFAQFGLPNRSSSSGSYQIECHTDFKQPRKTMREPPDVLEYFKSLDSRDANQAMEIHLTPLRYFCPSVPASVPMTKTQHLEDACQYLQALKAGFEHSEQLLDKISREAELNTSIGETLHGYKRDLDTHVSEYTQRMQQSFVNHRTSDEFAEAHHAGSLDSVFTYTSMDTSLNMFGRQTTDLCDLSAKLRQGIDATSAEELEMKAERLAKEIEDLFSIHDSSKQLEEQMSPGQSQFRIKRTRIEERNRDDRSCITWCIRCRSTCHEDCGYSNNEDKAKCCAMNSDGYCKECGCYWRLHRNTSTEQREFEYYESVPIDKVSKKYGENTNQRGAARRIKYHLGMDAKMALQKTAYKLVSAHRCFKGLHQGVDLDQFIRDKLRSKRLDPEDSSKLIELTKAIDARVEDRTDYARFEWQSRLPERPTTPPTFGAVGADSTGSGTARIGAAVFGAGSSDLYRSLYGGRQNRDSNPQSDPDCTIS